MENNCNQKIDTYETIQHELEMVLRYIIFWESDDKNIGIIIQMFNHAFFYGMILWYIYLHTFSNSYVQFVLFCVIYFLGWIHYLFYRAFLLFKIEQKLIGNHTSIIDNILHIFHITPSEEVSNGVLLLVSSLIMVMLGAELLSRTIACIHQFM
jgi:hypothetical protein